MVDTITRFISSSSLERFQMILNQSNRETIRNYLGEIRFEEYTSIAERVIQNVSNDHLAVDVPKNLIFIPGVMGSSIQSETYGGTWWLDVRSLHRINDLALASNGQSDMNANFRLRAGTTDISYEPFMGAVLERDDFGHEIFPYDWRKPLLLSTHLLRDNILRLYEENGHRKIHLVAHSMGGLLVRAMLMNYGDELWTKIGKIVFLGTPHYGSPAIASYLKNHLWGFDLMALLGLYLSPTTFRTLYGVLSLLPAPAGIYPGTRENDKNRWTMNQNEDQYIHPCANFDLYRSDSWHLNITSSEQSALQQALNKTYQFHQQIYESHIRLEPDLCDRMLVIAGVGFKTLFRLAYRQQFWGLWQYTEKVKSRLNNNPHREGDGAVPLASATLDYVQHRCVPVQHGALPNVSSVYNEVFRWLNGQRLELPSSPSGALSEHLASDNYISDAPSLDNSISRDINSDEIDRWQDDPISSEELNNLREQLESGYLPEFFGIRLL